MIPMSPRGARRAGAAALLAAGLALTTSAPTAAQLPARAAAVDSLSLQRALDSSRTALAVRGLSAAMVLADGSRWAAASGMADGSRPLTPAMLFEIGSVTKSYTAALVLHLVADGVLTLDQPVGHLLPEFPDASEITVRQLLQHTSGLYNYSEDPEYVGALGSDFDRVWAPEESIRFIKRRYFAPGTGWHYSNANYLALGLIVERVTSRPYLAELRRRILDPRGLRSTFLDKREPVAAERAHGFVDVNGDGKPEDLTQLVPNTSFITAAWAAAGLVATAEDVAVWAHALHRGDVVPASLYAELTRWVERGDGRQYGLGIQRDATRGPVLLGHRGNGAGYSAAVWHREADGVTVAVLANGHGLDLTDAARALLATIPLGAPAGD